MIAGRDSRFRGTQGTAIIVFGAVAAWTGASEKTLERLGNEDFEKVYLYPNSHAGYYPGATPIAMKVLFRKSDGLLLGAQAVGEDGLDKRMSALAVAIQMGATIYDLEETERLLRDAHPAAERVQGPEPLWRHVGTDLVDELSGADCLQDDGSPIPHDAPECSGSPR